MKNKIKEKVLKEYNKLDDVTFDKLGNENKLNDFLVDLTLAEVRKEIKDIDFEKLIEENTWYPDDLDRPRQIHFEDIKKKLLNKIGGKSD